MDESKCTSKRGKSKINQEQAMTSRSWKKQFGQFFASPVHAMRRLFSKKRTQRPATPEPAHTSSPQKLTIKEQNHQKAVEIAKRRKIPCYFLFLGLSQSGKSTTISKLFNCERPNQSETGQDHSFKIFRNGIVGENVGLNILDTPGLLGRYSTEQDAETVIGLSAFLKKELPTSIPTVTFILARLDDNRFEGEQSDFSRMLNAISLARKQFTDKRCSNIVLLLTHSEKARVQKDDIKHKAARYQMAFNSIFHNSEPVCVIPIDNIRDRQESSSNEENPTSCIKRYHDVIFNGLKDFALHKNDHSLLELMGWLQGKAKRFSIQFSQEIEPIKNVLPPRRGLISKVTACLIDNEIKSGMLDSESETDEEGNYEPYLVTHHTPNQKKKRKKSTAQSSSSTKLLTCIPLGSQVIMADKSIMKIDDCLVGDKVLSLNSSPSVIMNIERRTIGNILQEGDSIGTIYCAAKPTDSAKQNKTTYIYAYQNKSFRLVNAATANIPEKKRLANEQTCLLTLDSPDGTIIVNGFACMTHNDGLMSPRK